MPRFACFKITETKLNHVGKSEVISGGKCTPELLLLLNCEDREELYGGDRYIKTYSDMKTCGIVLYKLSPTSS